jgi:hypothetical protein
MTFFKCLQIGELKKNKNETALYGWNVQKIEKVKTKHSKQKIGKKPMAVYVSNEKYF